MLITMETIKARGRLHHHFHGQYWATIGLWFDSVELATKAHKILGHTWGVSANLKVLTYSGKDSGLETEIVRLEKLGADRKKITSLAHSIDFGEEFYVTMEIE